MFMCALEHAPDTVEPNMIKPKKPARIAPPPGLSKTPTRSAFEALEGAEETSAIALEPAPRREIRNEDEIRGGSECGRACQYGYMNAHPEQGNARTHGKHRVPIPLGAGSRDVPAPPGNFNIQVPELLLYKNSHAHQTPAV